MKIIIKQNTGCVMTIEGLLFHSECLTSAAFTYYYDPAILRNKLTPLSIFKEVALRK